MAEHNCADCAFRTKYDAKPKSFLGRLWRWHANWCPGWKTFMNSLSAKEKSALADKYNLEKFK